MSKVYVIQDNGKHNYQQAEKYGQLIFCGGRRDINAAFGLLTLPSNVEVVSDMFRVLSEFTVEDRLVLSGNPLMIALAVHYIMQKNGTIRVLKWDGFAQGYYELGITDDMLRLLQ